MHINVGVVNMCGNKNGCSFLVKVLKEMGCRVTLVEKDAPILQTIKASRIRRWILSGVTMHEQAPPPPVPMEIFSLSGKSFLLICFSMESVLQQYGYPLLNRYLKKTEYAKIPVDQRCMVCKDIPNPMRIFRNHALFIPSRVIRPPMKLLSSYEGEAMIVLFKNALFTQFHPERSAHGRILLRNWLHLT